MKTRIYTLPIRRPLTREELRRERRRRLAENVVTIVAGIAIVVVLFWAGWLVGSGAIKI